MAYNAKAVPHAFDHATIACACGCTVGYRAARSNDPLRCRACDALWAPPAPAAEQLSPKVRALCDAWDNAAARGLSGDSSVAIPRALYEAVVEARSELP